MELTFRQIGPDLEIKGLCCFNALQIFDCGQTFRFSPDESGAVRGIAHGRELIISQPRADTVMIKNTGRDEFENTWRTYFALDDDYDGFRSAILESSGNDSVIRSAMECGGGIRILHQDPWETLCSFIVSQNNNIPRIKTIIGRLCSRFGKSIGDGIFDFPTAERLCSAGTDEIFSCGTGFRAKYIFDAASRVSSGETDLHAIAAMETPRAAEELCRIKGVGPKVAACSLLFGFGKMDAFPIDVWVKRVIAKYYPDGFEPSLFGSCAGLAQQYLFYYERYEGGEQAK